MSPNFQVKSGSSTLSLHWYLYDMNNHSAFPPKLQSVSRSSSLKNVHSISNHGSKKILVNPLVAGNNIHYNKGKYTVASSTFGVKVSSGSSGTRCDNVHYNPKFLGKSYVAPKKENVHVNPNYLAATTRYSEAFSNAIHVNPNFLSSAASSTCAQSTYSTAPSYTPCSVQFSNKYKYVRKDDSKDPKLVVSTQQISPEPKSVSKYKLVYSTAPSIKPINSISKSPGIVIKSKYSIRTCQPNAKPTTPVRTSSLTVNRDSKKRISCDFKRISRTKLVRKSVLLSRKHLKRRFSIRTNQRRLIYSKGRKQLFILNNKSVINRSRASSECGSFQSYSSTKIIRKSVLRAQIDSRKLLRKSLNSSVTHVVEVTPIVKSKYKLVRKGFTKKATEDGSPSKRSQSISKVKKRKSIIAKLTSKLRKNNQRCMFYNRFGRCKGKDRGTCNKIHDPLYVSICKKLPFGECTDKSCLLSHDVKPGKMPTCYHYLAGICKRDDCPYLHIKVNPKAPICHSFLQGYCADVLNCMKRHEYVCPVFAEKGTCPKGKSCAHPHKIPTVHSKLLCDDQRPLMAKTQKPKESSPLFIISDTGSDQQTTNMSSADSVNPLKPPSVFTRYFAVPLSSEHDDSADHDTSDALGTVSQVP
uniref:Zinc finger CCCH domain-containing protein 7 n=2 Tax=Lygus hesperus TaxID=30085 RepID=A0A0A9VTS2_LYGHE